MKPVRRRINKHFGLTSKQVAIKSKRPWYFDWFLWGFLLVLGYGIAFLQYNYGTISVNEVVSENQSLHTQLIKIERQMQMQQSSHEKLQQELKLIQVENLKTREDLLFYKNMLEKKKRKK